MFDISELSIFLAAILVFTIKNTSKKIIQCLKLHKIISTSRKNLIYDPVSVKIGLTTNHMNL